MDVQEVREQVRIQEWMELIRERNSSGMTIREWCQSKGLSENQYYYWLRKIRKTACTALESRDDLAFQVQDKLPAFAQINIIPDAHPDAPVTSFYINRQAVSNSLTDQQDDCG